MPEVKKRPPTTKQIVDRIDRNINQLKKHIYSYGDVASVTHSLEFNRGLVAERGLHIKKLRVEIRTLRYAAAIISTVMFLLGIILGVEFQTEINNLFGGN